MTPCKILVNFKLFVVDASHRGEHVQHDFDLEYIAFSGIGDVRDFYGLLWRLLSESYSKILVSSTLMTPCKILVNFKLFVVDASHRGEHVQHDFDLEYIAFSGIGDVRDFYGLLWRLLSESYSKILVSSTLTTPCKILVNFKLLVVDASHRGEHDQHDFDLQYIAFSGIGDVRDLYGLLWRLLSESYSKILVTSTLMTPCKILVNFKLFVVDASHRGEHVQHDFDLEYIAFSGIGDVRDFYGLLWRLLSESYSKILVSSTLMTLQSKSFSVWKCSMFSWRICLGFFYYSAILSLLLRRFTACSNLRW